MILASLQSRLVLAVGLACSLIIVFLVANSAITARDAALRQAKEEVRDTATSYGAIVKAEAEVALDTARTLAHTFAGVKHPESPLDIGRDSASVILKTVLESNADFLGVYTCWEPNAFDGMDEAYAGLAGHDKTGRYVPYWSRDKDKGITLCPLQDYETEGIGDYYLRAKRTHREVAIGPYAYPVAGKYVWMVSLVAPIMANNEFQGIAGVDVLLEQLQAQIEKHMRYSGQAEMAVVSGNGLLIAASGNPGLIGKAASELIQDSERILAKTKTGSDSVFETETHVEFVSSIGLGEIEQAWGVYVRVPKKSMLVVATRKMNEQIIGGALLLFAALAFIFFFVRRTMRPLTLLASAAERVAVGDLDFPMVRAGSDEIGRVAASFDNLVDNLREVTTTCEAISQGDLSHQVRVRSENDVLASSVNLMAGNLQAVVRQAHFIIEGNYETQIVPRSENDQLGHALKSMTERLRNVTSENERRTWVKTAQTELNDLMRGEQSIAELGRTIISFLARNIDALRGAIYMSYSDEDAGKRLRLIATHACMEGKAPSNECAFGERLLGQAALERQRIIVRDVPSDYMVIASGLGEASPASVLVLPCVYDNDVVAIVELAGFGEFADHHLDFLDQVSDNIAVALSTTESRIRLAGLFKQTRLQTEELRSQREALIDSNRGLEEQTEALRASESRLEVQQEELRQINEELQAQQEELRAANEELGERARELEAQRDDIRTKNDELELTRVELEEKARALDITSRYKSEFLANMSHELRTPLNSMLVLSQVLSQNKDGNLTEKQIKAITTIHGAGADLLELINDILDISKVEAGKLELHVEEFDLESVCSSLDFAIRPMVEQKGLEFVVELSQEGPSRIVSDRHRIEQILRNLLSNAVKFTHKGHIKFTVGHPKVGGLLTSGLVPTETVAFSVSDTGIGVPSEKQALIFEAFQQADGTTSRKYGGTGLGLSISRELARLLGGELRLHSEEGAGSTFTLYLPLRCPHGKAGDFAKASDTLGAKLEKSLNDSGGNQLLEPHQQENRSVVVKKMDTGAIKDDRKGIESSSRVILIIEDDAAFAQTLMDIAHDHGFKCVIAEDGAGGLHNADYHKPAAIILDVGLPDMTGWEVMKRLKENPATANIPVHFMSANNETQDALKMGAIGYLQKPVTLEGLSSAFTLIGNVMEDGRSRVLIVEDDENLCESVKLLLGSEEVDPVCVHSGREAIDRLRNGHFNCVILDIGLPDISGMDLLESVRNDPAIPEVPFIVYTGRDLSQDEERLVTKYAESIIVKSARSPERLLDETALFLHKVRSESVSGEERMLKLMHEKESVFAGKKILVVDDDMRNMFALTSLLEEKSMVTIEAKDGRESLLRLKEHPDTNLVLMDIMMPGMDGYEAITEIRKQGKFAKLPIIALTAKAMKGDRAKCIEVGANDYLAKPVDTAKLLSMIRVWLYH